MLSDSHPSWRPRPWGSYQLSRAQRCADRRSLATVRSEVMRCKTASLSRPAKPTTGLPVYARRPPRGPGVPHGVRERARRSRDAGGRRLREAAVPSTRTWNHATRSVSPSKAGVTVAVARSGRKMASWMEQWVPPEQMPWLAAPPLIEMPAGRTWRCGHTASRWSRKEPGYDANRGHVGPAPASPR